MTTNQDQFILAYVLHFSDGGEDECGVLHQGSIEDCKYIRDNIPAIFPAICYSGPRPSAGAEWRIVKVEEGKGR